MLSRNPGPVRFRPGRRMSRLRTGSRLAVIGYELMTVAGRGWRNSDPLIRIER
jgi:hypothetical protein